MSMRLEEVNGREHCMNAFTRPWHPAGELEDLIGRMATVPGAPDRSRAWLSPTKSAADLPFCTDAAYIVRQSSFNSQGGEHLQAPREYRPCRWGDSFVPNFSNLMPRMLSHSFIQSIWKTKVEDRKLRVFLKKGPWAYTITSSHSSKRIQSSCSPCKHLGHCSRLQKTIFMYRHLCLCYGWAPLWYRPTGQFHEHSWAGRTKLFGSSTFRSSFK